MIEKDWIELKTERLLAAAKRTGFFQDVINDAKQIESDHGYSWDVSLAKSCEYWCDERTFLTLTHIFS